MKCEGRPIRHFEGHAHEPYMDLKYLKKFNDNENKTPHHCEMNTVITFVNKMTRDTMH